MKDDEIYLMHIRDAAANILSDTASGEASFMSDRKTQDAVVRNLEIIGEAVKNISITFKNRYPELPWKAIAGMRDKLIHEYFGVNLKIVWEVTQKRVPELKGLLDKILGPSK